MFDLGLCNKFFPGSNLSVIIGIIAVFIIGYLLGSLNFGVIISKIMYHDDIRKYGSKSGGATNMLRTYGKIPAAMTFLCDGLKTVIAVYIGALVLGTHNGLFEYPAGSGIVYMGYSGMYIGGLGSIIGHAFPVYYKFKGGKSVAATCFMVLCTEPVIFLILIVIFIALVAGTKFISLGSVMCVIIYPLILNRFTGYGLHNVFAIVIMFLVVFLHRANIQRLVNGTESKLNLSLKKKEKNSE